VEEVKLYEYHGKSIFSRYGIRIPSGFVASSPEEVAEISKGLRFTVMV
jgi:succinyl-CoA synthetase beta subunit